MNKGFTRQNFAKQNLGGFTLVEVLVVAAITGVITTFMLVNFQRSRIDLTLTTNEFVANLRSAQTRALASARYDTGTGPKVRCGYGIRYISPGSYAMYAGPDASSVSCAALNKNFDGADSTVFTRVFTDVRVEFKSPFNDIFFEPPDQKTYINNNSALGLPPQAITIGKIGGTCPNDCKTINVYTSGKIE
ncbi:MAG: prepilin-type N-terminal cleavage/methylation domain-containing protein [Candidatus Yanofskybacteria bacterium]|nr:prepilin-type N-terminal cleavage/methylation domain-containing protein [Candidatus Yanofskybacteria bacterium]